VQWQGKDGILFPEGFIEEAQGCMLCHATLGLNTELHRLKEKHYLSL
jgi:hypothetical protein